MTLRPAAGALLVLMALGAIARAEDPPAGQPTEKAMGSCQQMMQKEKEGVAALESKTAAMNATQGAHKVDAITAVANELVAQHRAMLADRGCPMMGQMREKMEGMMGGTMENGRMEHGTMPPDAPGSPSGGTAP